MNRVAVLGLGILLVSGFSLASRAEAPEVPKIDNVVMLRPQPHESGEAVIWYDDFDGDVKAYGETEGGLSEEESFGGDGHSMISQYDQGSQGVGNRKVFFGDSPYGRNLPKRGQRFDDVYWRIYLKHQYGWTGGGPDKLSRATSLVSPNWAQAMIAHVWSSGETLTLDPASGVEGDRVVTERYNDFDHLHWLGNKPTARFPIHSTKESGRWVCVEAHARLNTPGQKDGVQELWIDGRLEAQRTALNWRGSYDKHGINAVFLESYWNDGSPVTQTRWMDNFVISTEPIGPVVCPRNPTLLKTEFCGDGEQKGWEVELAEGDSGDSAVWRSNFLTDPRQVRVDAVSGQFLQPSADASELEPNRIYFVRVRQQSNQGEWSEWSGWHQPFRTESAAGSVGDWSDGHESR